MLAPRPFAAGDVVHLAGAVGRGVAASFGDFIQLI